LGPPRRRFCIIEAGALCLYIFEENLHAENATSFLSFPRYFSWESRSGYFFRAEPPFAVVKRVTRKRLLRTPSWITIDNDLFLFGRNEDSMLIQSPLLFFSVNTELKTLVSPPTERLRRTRSCPPPSTYSLPTQKYLSSLFRDFGFELPPLYL